MKFSLNIFAVGVLLIFLAACSSTRSSIANEKIGYAISRKQAKEIVDSSIMANFSPDYVNQGPEASLTSSGYIRFAVDTHTINATAIPMSGILPNGQKADGYGFEVNAFGSMPIQGGAKAESVYRLVKQQAGMAGSVLTVR